MLESKLKKWQGKKVEVTYIHRDTEGNVYCPFEAMEELKKDITRQGFTYTEKEKTIEIDGTNQFFWKPKNNNKVGIFNARTTKYEIFKGDELILSGYYPTKKDIVDHDKAETFFTKKVGNGIEITFRLI